jgi:hypothetical protein
MKKLLMILFLAVAFSCENTEEDMDSNWVKFANITPISGTTITTPTDIKLVVKYNVSKNEIGENGFAVGYWEKLDGRAEWGGAGSKHLTVRNGEYPMTIYSVDERKLYLSRTYGFSDTISFKIGLHRLKPDGGAYIIEWSEPIIYYIK